MKQRASRACFLFLSLGKRSGRVEIYFHYTIRSHGLILLNIAQKYLALYLFELYDCKYNSLTTDHIKFTAKMTKGELLNTSAMSSLCTCQ
jgi:hypothetical protein